MSTPAPSDTAEIPARTPSRRDSIPNALTLARVVLAVGVIALLSIYDHTARAVWPLPVAAALFIVAALTDTLDGIPARRWNAVSVFGRVMDPFADKALVLGSFIVLAGPGFANIDGAPIAGVTPWMAVILLARELLVTSIRGVMEGAGVSFAANRAGKAKMVLQSVAVPLILVVLWLGPRDAMGDPVLWVRAAIGAAAWVTVLVTVFSGWPYVAAAARAAGAGRQA